jgi:hypothetical protein
VQLKERACSQSFFRGKFGAEMAWHHDPGEEQSDEHFEEVKSMRVSVLSLHDISFPFLGCHSIRE